MESIIMSELPFYNLNDKDFVHFMLDLSNSAHDLRSILQLRNSNTDIVNNLGYDFISAPRQHKLGGGTGLYISKNLSYSVCVNLPAIYDNLVDYCAIEILNEQSTNIIIISLYKPPDVDLTTFDIKFAKFIQEIQKI